jgi:hypothetical protein
VSQQEQQSENQETKKAQHDPNEGHAAGYIL